MNDQSRSLAPAPQAASDKLDSSSPVGWDDTQPVSVEWLDGIGFKSDDERPYRWINGGVSGPNFDLQAWDDGDWWLMDSDNGIRLLPQKTRGDVRLLMRALGIPSPLPAPPRLDSSGWQDISTAPKDGTAFIGYWDDPDDLHVVCIRDGQCYREMDREAWAMPTFWHALPAPPVQEQAMALCPDCGQPFEVNRISKVCEACQAGRSRRR